MHTVPSTWWWDLSQWSSVSVRSGWKSEQTVLSEPLSSRQTIPWPQDIILRCWTILVLHLDTHGRWWITSDWLLFKGILAAVALVTVLCCITVAFWMGYFCNPKELYNCAPSRQWLYLPIFSVTFPKFTALLRDKMLMMPLLCGGAWTSSSTDYRYICCTLYNSSFVTPLSITISTFSLTSCLPGSPHATTNNSWFTLS